MRADRHDLATEPAEKDPEAVPDLRFKLPGTGQAPPFPATLSTCGFMPRVGRPRGDRQVFLPLGLRFLPARCLSDSSRTKPARTSADQIPWPLTGRDWGGNPDGNQSRVKSGERRSGRFLSSEPGSFLESAKVHRRTAKRIRRERFPQLDPDASGTTPASSYSFKYVEEIQLAQRWEEVCARWLPANGRRRLLYARGLRRIGYLWPEIKTKVGWPGPLEELREAACQAEVVNGSRVITLSYARFLRKLEYGWPEIRTEVDWPGTQESLRVAVYRFLKKHSRIRELLA